MHGRALSQKGLELELQREMVVETRTFFEEGDDKEELRRDKEDDSLVEDGDQESGDEKKVEGDAELLWDDNEDLRQKTCCSCRMQALVVLIVAAVACATISVTG